MPQQFQSAVLFLNVAVTLIFWQWVGQWRRYYSFEAVEYDKVQREREKRKMLTALYFLCWYLIRDSKVKSYLSFSNQSCMSQRMGPPAPRRQFNPTPLHKFKTNYQEIYDAAGMIFPWGDIPHVLRSLPDVCAFHFRYSVNTSGLRWEHRMATNHTREPT